MFSGGLVQVVSSLNVTVGANEIYQYDSKTLVNGYAFGNTPWHPVGVESPVLHVVKFSITLPIGVSKYIDIYEAIDLRAMRYFSVSLCNAVVQCSTTFSPVVVNVFNKR